MSENKMVWPDGARFIDVSLQHAESPAQAMGWLEQAARGFGLALEDTTVTWSRFREPPFRVVKAVWPTPCGTVSIRAFCDD